MSVVVGAHARGAARCRVVAPARVEGEAARLDASAFGVDEDEVADYESMTVADLRKLAAERGVKLPAKASKARIIELLEG